MSSRTLAKKLASVKPGTLFAGVDLALDRNVVVVVNYPAASGGALGTAPRRQDSLSKQSLLS